MTSRVTCSCRGCAILGLALPALLATTDARAAGRPVTVPSSDGTTLAAQIYEASSRPAPGIVLVHMLSRSKTDWDEVAQQLESAGITALAIDLRGHGASGGSAGSLGEMTKDVRAAVQWLSTRPAVRPDAIAVGGASLGANLALLAAAEQPLIRAVVAVSPSLEYRGVRVGPDLMKKLGDRPVWLAASSDDPFAARTIHELTADGAGARYQQLSPTVAHGTRLLAADKVLARALVDWLRQRLLS
jgi:alpha-beta hydrolase superfamily lysophospholipase